VEERKHELNPTKEQQLKELVKEVAFKYLHRAKIIVHHRSIWKDMIPPLGYHDSRERNQRILKINFLSVRRFGKKTSSPMRIQNFRN
jgi:hypothetical protein